MFRSQKKMSKEVSLYEPIGSDKEGNEISLLDVVEHDAPTIAEETEKRQDIVQLYQMVDKYLSGRERIVIELRYGLYNQRELTQKEIAKKLGISRSYVSRIEKSGILKLREKMKN